LDVYSISFDVVLTVNLHMQTDKSTYQYRGMFHALGTIYREEGFRALYKGWLPFVIRAVGSL
jgi:solute carrier family 25 (mitochondrial phosphate transporter), member 23/24/25/41